MTLVSGLPKAMAAAVPALVRGMQQQQQQQSEGVGVVVAAGQPGGVFEALVSLQEEQKEDEAFVMCSLGGMGASAEEAAAWLKAGAEEVGGWA